MSKSRRVDYGIDAPYVLCGLGIGGVACCLCAAALPAFRWMFSPALSLLATCAVWLYGSLVGKRSLRDKILARISWSGDEQVLDAGCGSGLLLIGAAKRLTTGKAVGVDIWRTEDLTSNSPQKTLDNARLEGVADRVEVETGDLRHLPFEDSTFDVVLSLNVIHNIADRAARDQALREILRVLKPGGGFALCDFRNTRDYVKTIVESGAEANRCFIGWVGFFPMYAAVATRLRP